MNLFTVNSAVYMADEAASYRPVHIQIGDVTQDFMAIQQSVGSAPFRTQADVTADGTVYVVTGGAGAGTATITLFDGPYINCGGPGTLSISSALQHCLRMSDLKSRRIIIGVMSGGLVSGASNVPTSGKFYGFVNNLNINVTDMNGGMFVLVTVSAIGSWEIG